MRTHILLLTALALPLLAADPSSAAATRATADPATTIKQLVRASDARPALERLYEATAGQPLWLERGRPTAAATRLIERLAGAASVGLDPADYDADWLTRPRAASEDAARFDVTLSAATLRYVSALACGRVDPVTLGGKARKAGDCPDADVTVALLRDVHRQDAALADVEPQFAPYQMLKKGLARYRDIARDSTLVPLPAIAADLKPGMPLPAAPALRKLLRATGDLPGKKSPKAKKDIVYAPDLVEAVKRFQARQGYLPDGILWSQTLEQLNRPFPARIRQIELALERWRSLRPTFDTPPVIVNVPAFRLQAYRALPDQGGDALAMDVLVGAAVKSETPLFSAPMTHIIFRPYWDVPADIANFEMGPRALVDRENMERLGYVLVKADGSDATELPLTPENVARIGKGLRMRQRPGDGNALGLIKFMLPNGHDIYLHDTSAQGLFVMPRRDFSHGCIRVADPVALATQMLADTPGWTAERVKSAMESGEDNTRVNLATPVPVMITYATAVANEAGEVSFYTDIYGLDKKLEEQLAEGGTARARRTAQGRISTRVPTGITR